MIARAPETIRTQLSAPLLWIGRERDARHSEIWRHCSAGARKKLRAAQRKLKAESEKAQNL